MYQPDKQSYPEYYLPYVQLALGTDLIKKLETNLHKLSGFFEAIPEELHEFAYEPGKWTPKDIILHLIDTERIFSYRALKIIRGEGEGLKSFDQDVFVLNAQANEVRLAELIEMYV
ncbi:DinB family protein [Winogradskyella aurantiaca]|uniref:DinB family protein n=1 Tax=Winogradskyella aurantiaca TaxID=2219558 RepID=UPI000E1CDDE9|nr:DinB family protein [Winogradskyella aurantiaca]